MESMGINEKLTVITGATSGIGKATALAFAKENARLMLIARNKQVLNDVSDSCQKLGAQVIPFAADVTDDSQGRQAANFEHGFSRLHLCPLNPKHDFSADHLSGQATFRRGLGLQACCHLPTPEHGHPIAD